MISPGACVSNSNTCSTTTLYHVVLGSALYVLKCLICAELMSSGRHLCDLQDHVDTGQESLAACMVWSDELTASYRRYGEYRQDKCLLLFALIEIFFMPGEFLVLGHPFARRFLMVWLCVCCRAVVGA